MLSTTSPEFHSVTCLVIMIDDANRQCSCGFCAQDEIRLHYLCIDVTNVGSKSCGSDEVASSNCSTARAFFS